jgi:tetratricopeptide (TPR) repeat protein
LFYHLQAGGAALAEAETFHVQHPLEPNPTLDRAIHHLQAATERAPKNGYAYRRLGQSWLLAGNNEAARDALSKAAALRPNHPLIHIELGMAYDGLGQAERALEAYERGGYGPAVEAAIVNYIKVADWQIAASAEGRARKLLNRALALEPNNVAVLYRMMYLYEDSDATAQVRARLGRLPDEEEISLPTDARLASYVQQAATALLEEGVWTSEEAERVLAGGEHVDD